MILSWMIYSLIVSLLFAMASWPLERVVRERGWPVRGVWVVALLASLVLPILTGLLPSPAPAPSVQPLIGELVAPPVAGSGMEWIEWTTAPLSTASAPVRDFDFDPWLLALWAIASIVLALSLAVSYWMLVRRRRKWVPREMDGRSVWVSADTGPAVIGFIRSRIVLPEWILGAGASDRAIVLAHEEEHVRAGDSRLLLGALLVAVALPWNLPLWWMWRSLRRAVEIDCDLRVLSRGVDPRAYSRLLVEVTERGTAHRLMVTALSESSFLETRVRLMLTSQRQGWWRRAAGAFLLAGICVLAACQTDRPDQSPVPSTGATYAVEKNGSLTRLSDTATVIPSELISDSGTVPLASSSGAGPLTLNNTEDLTPLQVMMRAAVERFYPNMLTEQMPGGRVNLYFLADARGEMIKTGFDTEARSGNCGSILRSGLGGGAMDPKATDVIGCGKFGLSEGGPNKVAVFYAALKPRPGEENASPTGPFLFAEAARSDRPSEADLRAAVERHHPDALRGELPFGEALWFVVDRNNQVIHTGRGARYGSSTTASQELEKKFPGTRIGPVLMSSQVRDIAGERISLIWARVEEPGSRSASAASPRGPNPFADIRTYAVTSATPGQEVRIRLEGEATNDPGAFRIDGTFSRQGDALVARTPFMFAVVSRAPFEASFTSAVPGEEIQLTYGADTSRSRMEGKQIFLRRTQRGDPIRSEGNRRGRTVQRPESPAVILSARGSHL